MKCVELVTNFLLDKEPVSHDAPAEDERLLVRSHLGLVLTGYRVGQEMCLASSNFGLIS